MTEKYRGWSLQFQYGNWYGYSDNYDVSWEGYEDGYVSNGEEVCERTLEDAKDAIDLHIEERGYQLQCEKQTLWQRFCQWWSKPPSPTDVQMHEW